MSKDERLAYPARRRYIYQERIAIMDADMVEFILEGHGVYRIAHPEKIRTPRLILFKDKLEFNTAAMAALLQKAIPGGGFQNLRPHIKTNKCSYTVRKLLEAGVTAFKTTINEAELAASCGAGEVFVAYSLLEADAEYMADLAEKYPKVNFQVQAGSPAHLDILARTARRRGIRWPVFIDIDVGMHRTGCRPEGAFDLYSRIEGEDCFRFAGLHGYDGHIHQSSRDERAAASAAAMDIMVQLIDVFRDRGVRIPLLITSGSPSFFTDLDYLPSRLPRDVPLQFSPGTWVYWDSKYDGLIPGVFRFAALILAQVIDVIASDRVTLNLGHKRWAADQGPVERFSVPGLNVELFSEEHTVVSLPRGVSLQVGDYIAIVPRHVCPTVNLYEYLTVVDERGEILIPRQKVEARNR